MARAPVQLRGPAGGAQAPPRPRAPGRPIVGTAAPGQGGHRQRRSHEVLAGHPQRRAPRRRRRVGAPVRRHRARHRGVREDREVPLRRRGGGPERAAVRAQLPPEGVDPVPHADGADDAESFGIRRGGGRRDAEDPEQTQTRALPLSGGWGEVRVEATRPVFDRGPDGGGKDASGAGARLLLPGRGPSAGHRAEIDAADVGAGARALAARLEAQEFAGVRLAEPGDGSAEADGARDAYSRRAQAKSD